MSFYDDSQQSQDSVLTLRDENRVEILYFAYGSNLSTRQMLDRCPQSTCIGLARLPGWKWIINSRGYANIVPEDGSSSTQQQHSSQPSPASKDPDQNPDKKSNDGASEDDPAWRPDAVYGLLYYVTTIDEQMLDMYEGVPTAYEKQALRVERLKGQEMEELPEDMEDRWVTALVYVDTQRIEDGRVQTEYVERMQKGLRGAVKEWGMDERVGQWVWEEIQRAWVR